MAAAAPSWPGEATPAKAPRRALGVAQPGAVTIASTIA